MNTKNLVAILLVWAMATPATAARQWIENVQIQDILHLNASGTIIMTVDFETTASLDTGCAPTDAHTIASWWTGGNITSMSQNWLSILLAAQAQGFAVDLYVENSSCNTSSVWDAFGSPVGGGLAIEGVRINKP